MSQSMPLREHFRELRSRALVCTIALLVGTAVCFYFYQEIYAVLLWPAQHAATTDTVNPLRFYQDFGFGILRPGDATDAATEFKPVRTEITEFLSITVRVSLLGGFVLALPVILYNVVRFIAPGLTPRERKILFSFLPAALLAFVAGMAFGYFVMIPPALSFLIGFGSEVADPLIRISNLVNIMIRLLFWLGLSFETPLVMYVLAVLGVVNARSFARFRQVLAGRRLRHRRGDYAHHRPAEPGHRRRPAHRVVRGRCSTGAPGRPAQPRALDSERGTGQRVADNETGPPSASPRVRFVTLWRLRALLFRCAPVRRGLVVLPRHRGLERSYALAQRGTHARQPGSAEYQQHHQQDDQ